MSNENEELGGSGVDVDWCFFLPWDKFVYRHGGRWHLETPLVERAMRVYLIARRAGDKYTIREQFKNFDFPVANEIRCLPGRPSYCEEDGLRIINSWVAPTVRPTPTPWPRIEKVLEWLTDGDEAGQVWLCHWIAAKVQNPTFVPKVAVVLGSEQGAGKGVLSRVIREMLGPWNCREITQSELESRFNAEWVDKLFVMADEVVSNDRFKDVSNQLKVLIDSPRLRSERKHADQTTVENKLAWLFGSNDKISPVHLESGDRRYTAFFNFNPITPEHKKLFASCFSETDRRTLTPDFEKEIGGFMHELLNLKVDFELIKRPFQNGARESIITAGMPMHEQFFADVDARGIDVIFEPMLTRIVQHAGAKGLSGLRREWDFGDRGITRAALYECYQNYCRDNGGQPLKESRFGVACNNHTPRWPAKQRNPDEFSSNTSIRIVPRTPKSEQPTQPRAQA